MNRLRGYPLVRFVIPLLITVLLGGCWDYQDIDQRIFVLMIGVDVKDSGYLVTAQLTIPAPSGGQPSASGGGGTATTAEPYRVVSAQSPTVRGALEELNAHSYRELDFGQLLVTVVGEELAKQGLDQLDVLVRSPKIQLTGFIAISPTTAADILSATTPAQVIPAMYLFKAYQGLYTRAPEVLPVTTWDALIRRFHEPFQDIYAPGVATHPYGLNFAGVALFRDARLVGWLEPHEAALLNTLLRGKTSGDMHADDPRLGKLDARIDRGAVSYETLMVGGTPTLRVNLTLFVELVEASNVDIRSANMTNEVGSVLALAGQQRIEALLRRLQELQTDPLGFGERLRRKNAADPVLASTADWRQAYAKGTPEVQVRVRMRTRGRRE